MRVLHIIESLRSGGKERQLVELLTGLAERSEIRSDIVVMSQDVHYDVSAIPNVKLWPLLRRSQRDVGVWPRFGALLHKLKPDVVHSWGTMCSVYALPAVKLLGLPFVNGVVRDAPSGLTWADKDYRRARLTFPVSDMVVGNSEAGLLAYRAPSARSLL